MSYSVQRKSTPGSAWTSVGSGYSESSAFNEAFKQKAKYPNGFVRIIDSKTNQVVHTL
jgi:hypothetical protein